MKVNGGRHIILVSETNDGLAATGNMERWTRSNAVITHVASGLQAWIGLRSERLDGDLVVVDEGAGGCVLVGRERLNDRRDGERVLEDLCDCHASQLLEMRTPQSSNQFHSRVYTGDSQSSSPAFTVWPRARMRKAMVDCERIFAAG
jgi:hypothetical protein